MTRILQLTDLHVFSTPGTELKGILTRESLQDLVAHIQAVEQPFDHVIITGDHTHDELPAAYAAVREILSPWSDRLWQVPGNHDDRAVMRQVFSERIPGTSSDPINFRFEAGTWLCVGLDTHVPGAVAGNIDDVQLAWLQQHLATTRCRRVALFFHHPPIAVGSEWMDAIGLNRREKLQDVVRGDDRIRLICCGHVHHEFEFSLGSARVFTTPSTGIQFDPAGDVPNFSTDRPGYRVIELNGDEFTTCVRRL